MLAKMLRNAEESWEKKMKSSNVLIKDGEQYAGKYVAFKSFSDRNVVCTGRNMASAFNNARKLGVKEPVVVFIPKKDMIHIY